MRASQRINVDSIFKNLLSQSVATQNNFCLTETQVIGLCYQAKNIMMAQPMLLELDPPINICGDFHGQFNDLKEMFTTIGYPSQDQNYLFLGDYVDRGKQSLECICLLFALKIKYPDTFFLLRGNHQCSELNKMYGFFDECKRKLSTKVWKIFCGSFNCIPVSAVVGSRIFCVHGGLSPYLLDLSEINTIKRPYEFQKGSLVADLLWSDPSVVEGWSQNIERGTSFCFGPDVVQKFIQKNDFDLICRSHQIVEDGFEFFSDKGLITIFSAPNYCNMFQNKGAVLVVDEDLSCKIRQFWKQTPFKYKGKRASTPSSIKRRSSRASEPQKRRQRRTIGQMTNHETILKALLNKQI